jgi:hypothetical protein
MSLIWIWAIIFALYIRTIKYNYVIDDNVKRSGYMYEVPLTAPKPDFFYTRPSAWYRVFMIGMHCVNTSVIYLLWGWAPALLFAVHPMAVWGTAWVTGNYYATATYFTLIAYYILHTFPNVWGALVAMPIFAAALNSTVCPITFPFLFLFTGTPWGLSLFIPLVIYLRGRKFTTGIKIRYDINNDKVLREGSVKFSYLRRFACMVRVIGKYTYQALCPDRLYFFDGFGRKLKERPEIWSKYHSFSVGFWVSLVLIITVFMAGMLISPVGILWFFVCISLHSQFNLTGQFYAQRYLYLSIIGICIVLGTALGQYPILLTVLATVLTVRSILFIGTWKNIESLWRNDVEQVPNYGQSLNNLAQCLLNLKEQPAWLINEQGALLFRALELEPDAWEIQMNIACWFSRIGSAAMCLEWTEKSIASLKPLGGITLPMELLLKQRDGVKEIVDKEKASANVAPVKQGEGLVDSLSLPTNESKTQEEGRDHGTRTKEAEGILEPIGVDKS